MSTWTLTKATREKCEEEKAGKMHALYYLLETQLKNPSVLLMN